jgi:hypothetical protein
MTATRQSVTGALAWQELSPRGVPLGASAAWSSPSDWYHDARRDIKELLLLPANWDPEADGLISQDAITTAEELVQVLITYLPDAIARPFVSPTLAGGVCLEFDDNATGVRAIFVVEPHEEVHSSSNWRGARIDWIIAAADRPTLEGTNRIRSSDHSPSPAGVMSQVTIGRWV